ncbi:tetratricopeptide repeat protein [Streptomyces sp. NPDC001812]|uniref:tetratricopeptide repeat protein n=1 Tax=Streptomyces sp. NPDC001812 TaxID=3364611 RepID=UPI0036843308
MARLSREKKPEQQQTADAANRAAVPIDVHVPAPVAGTGSRKASVGGVPVVAGPDEEVQQAVLNRLHRIALASGHAVLATIHDEGTGYVVPLRVDPDGASHFTGEPALMKPAAPAPTPAPTLPPAPMLAPAPAPAPIPVRDSTLTLRLRSAPEPVEAVPPGTVVPPTGEFGPPPLMGTRPHPAPEADHRRHPAPARTPQTPQAPLIPPMPSALPVPPAYRTPGPLPSADRTPPPALAPVAVPPRIPEPVAEAEPEHEHEPALDFKPPPSRGFDAVAEAVLGDEPPAVPGETRLAEPMGRINEAVRAGRIDTAARLAGETVTEASRTLGPEHPEVLKLRELSAYIAYLSDEPLHAFRLSLDLAGVHRGAGDAEAAYGNVRSAATAWRAVRDPLRGLELGRELIELWTGLAAEGGPAADEIEELESARTRMGRLTDRAHARHG